MVVINTQIDEDIRTELKVYAARHKKTMNQVIVELITDLIKNNEEK